MKKSTGKLNSGMGSHFKKQLKRFTKEHPNHTIADPKYEIYNDIISMLDTRATGFKGMSWLSKNKLINLSGTVKVLDVEPEYTAMYKLKLGKSETGMGQCSVFPIKSGGNDYEKQRK